MRLVKLYDNADQEIIIDMDIKPVLTNSEPLRDWLESRIAWGKPTLIIAGIVTGVSIVTMVLKHI